MLPAFDESLHERTMARVNRARRENLSASVRAPSRLNPLLAWIARGAVAVLLLGVGIGIWMGSGQMQQDRIDASTAAEFNEAIASLGQTAKPLRYTLNVPMQSAQRQIGLLKEDAATFGMFVTDQVRNLSVPIDTSKLPS